MTTAVRLPAVVGLVENVTVSEVAVAAVTVPTAPSLKATVLLAAVGSKPKPLMVSVVALSGQAGRAAGHDRRDRGDLHAAPLVAPSVVTTAVRLPAVVGLVENVTVSEVAVAAVTVPTAPSLKTTVLLPAVVSKPKPLMVSVVALAARLAVLLVTTGVTVATCTAVPLLTLSVVTTAVRLPAAVGLGGERHGERSRGRRGDGADRPVVEDDRVVGGRRIEAEAVDGERGRVGGQIGRAAGHDRRDRGHLDRRAAAHAVGRDHGRQAAGRVGLVENVTVSEVAVAAVTVPTAPSLKTTVLLAAVVSKPKPLMVSVVALAARLAVLLVTTGVTVATWTAAPLLTLSVVTTAVRCRRWSAWWRTSR